MLIWTQMPVRGIEVAFIPCLNSPIFTCDSSLISICIVKMSGQRQPVGQCFMFSRERMEHE
jgi:hypothetical protein